jgi:hypothetical protein
MLRQYSIVDPNALAANRRDPYGLDALGNSQNANANLNAVRQAVIQSPFGSLANVFASSMVPAGFVMNAQGVYPYGAANFSRIMEYVQVPSRFVGTDTMLKPEIFNYTPGAEILGGPITGPGDPRYYFQPPFNKVSRQRDPGRVNLNTVSGQRLPPTTEDPIPRIWSDVFDGIMHRSQVLDTVNKRRYGDMNGNGQLGHAGPAWRDVVLSRRGYAQVDAAGSTVDKPAPTAAPDTMQMGLNNNFPTMFANPFRSSDAGDLVPVDQMLQVGVDATLERVHPRYRGYLTFGTAAAPIYAYDPSWGDGTAPIFGDARDAGFGNDGISVRPNGAIPNTASTQDPRQMTQRDAAPLFSESRSQAFSDTNRNPYMMYQPMSRLGSLVTNRSGCFAVWITVGYFEVEPAPTADPTKPDWGNKPLYDHFGGDINLYNRVYPDGYMLGKELGSETGDVKRPRGFYIIDRTEEVGFKPGEDLNVEKAIRLKRRIE